MRNMIGDRGVGGVSRRNRDRASGRWSNKRARNGWVRNRVASRDRLPASAPTEVRHCTRNVHVVSLPAVIGIHSLNESGRHAIMPKRVSKRTLSVKIFCTLQIWIGRVKNFLMPSYGKFHAGSRITCNIREETGRRSELLRISPRRVVRSETTAKHRLPARAKNMEKRKCYFGAALRWQAKHRSLFGCRGFMGFGPFGTWQVAQRWVSVSGEWVEFTGIFGFCSSRDGSNQKIRMTAATPKTNKASTFFIIAPFARHSGTDTASAGVSVIPSDGTTKSGERSDAATPLRPVGERRLISPSVSS